MAEEVAKAEHLPRTVLAGPIRWLGEKLNLFTDEVVKTAGKAAGVAAVAGAAVQLPHVTEAAHRVIQLLH